MVAGLGESLVSNTPGSAFRCTARKDLLDDSLDASAADGCLEIEGYPSKGQMLVADSQRSGLIFRSDSNGEDLEGYFPPDHLPPPSPPPNPSFTPPWGDLTLTRISEMEALELLAFWS
jgi:hypothetical protein